VLVDIVGVSRARLPYWENYSMTKYWRAGDDARKDAHKKTFDFVSGEALTQTLSSTDPIWTDWLASGVTHIVVLADLPGLQSDKPGTQDPRRQILPLDKCHWPDKTTSLTIEVQKSGIDVRTPVR
jgi:hypothetical protein